MKMIVMVVSTKTMAMMMITTMIVITMVMRIKTCRYLSCNAEEDSAMTSLACF